MGKNASAGMRAADYDILKAATEDLFKKVIVIFTKIGEKEERYL
jgi:hypothetical protein